MKINSMSDLKIKFYFLISRAPNDKVFFGSLCSLFEFIFPVKICWVRVRLVCICGIVSFTLCLLRLAGSRRHPSHSLFSLSLSLCLSLSFSLSLSLCFYSLHSSLSFCRTSAALSATLRMRNFLKQTNY